MSASRPLHVVVAGAGVAGLEAVLALHELAAGSVRVTLLDPSEAFVLRPLTVAEPFAEGAATTIPLAALVEDTGCEHVREALAGVAPERHEVTTDQGRTIGYDALVLALGARNVPAFTDALTFDPAQTRQLAGLLEDVEQGYSRRVAVVVPAGPSWPLPAYELALLVARHASGMQQAAEITLVTPEARPLVLFGDAVAEDVAALLEEAGVRFVGGSAPEVAHGTVTAGGERLEVDRVLALPALVPRAIDGIAGGEPVWLPVDGHGRVAGVEDVYAAGDGTTYPVKQGGLATQQADAVAAHLAARAGADIDPPVFTPVLRGELITGGAHRWMRRDVGAGDLRGATADHCLWWPPTKIAGRHISRWVEARSHGAIPDPPAPSRHVEMELPHRVEPSVGRDIEFLDGP